MRKRVSLTLKESLIKKVDNFIDTFGSRSRTVERFLEQFFEANRFAVILAGGHAKNLWIAELKTYRPLVKINGSYLIEDIIRKAKRAGFDNIIIVGSKEILDALRKVLNDVIFIEEKKHGHTGNTLVLAKRYLKTTFLFLPCDHYFDFDLRKLEKIHLNNDFTVTLAIYGGGKYTWHKSSIVELDGNNITSYWEKPSKETLLTSTLIGFAEPRIFNFISDKKTSLQSDVFPMLVKKKEIGGAIVKGNFVNVHTKKDLERIKKLI